MKKNERAKSVFHGTNNRQAGKHNSLRAQNPKLARQWHPIRNAPLTPNDVTVSSNKKVWWVCKKGHEWAALISNRSQGSGCPFCAGQRAAKDNCLQTVNPKLAREWHPKRNAPLTPKDVTAGSDKKAWWVCKQGHEWEAAIGGRTRGARCPYCAGQKACNDNCLQTTNPTLAKEWHPTRNAPLTPRDVLPNSHKKAWWVCQNGHIWEAAVSSRTRGSGCLYCAGHKPCKDNCLRTIDPKLAREWHPTKNAFMTPKDVTAGSGRKVWWKCGKGHEWEAAICSRTGGTGCPYCSNRAACKDNSLQAVNPKLAKEWHPTKNASLTPRDVVVGSNKKVWWLCKEGHEWESHISNRSRGFGCPYCAGQRATSDNCLQVVRPDLAREWHPLKNGLLSPKNVQAGSNKKIWWMCKKGHEWKTTVAHRSAGRGCPYCSGKKASSENCLGTVHPDIAKEWHPVKNAPLTPRDVTYGTDKKFWWICRNGHEWHATVLNRHQGRGCPYCSGRRPTRENSLETKGLWLAKQWHPTKNEWWTPKDVAPCSQKQIWWKCGKGHESREPVCSRYKRGGCAVCLLKRKAPRLFEPDECR